MKFKAYTFGIDIWEGTINVVFTDDKREYMKGILKGAGIKPTRKYLPSENERAVTTEIIEDSLYGIYMLFPTNIESCGIIAHESLHLIRLILEYNHTKLSDKTEEVWACTIEYVSNQIERLYKEAKQEGL